MAAARVYALVALPTASLECIAVALAPIYHVAPCAARAYTLATDPRLSVHSYWRNVSRRAMKSGEMNETVLDGVCGVSGIQC